MNKYVTVFLYIYTDLTLFLLRTHENYFSLFNAYITVINLCSILQRESKWRKELRKRMYVTKKRYSKIYK